MNRTAEKVTPSRRMGSMTSHAPLPRPATRRPWHVAWRFRWAWGVAIMIGALIWASGIRVATGPAAGSAFEGSLSSVQASDPAGEAATRNTLRIGVFNIHGGRGADHNRDLARTAECLRGFDFVGLNEVLGPKLWWQTDQCRQLGEMLDMAWEFAPTESRWWDGSFGNGLLSAVPVSAWMRIPLPRAGAHTHRNVVLSTIDLGGRPVRVLLTHLDSRDEQRRHEQLRAVGELFLSLEEPAVLMGDMNTRPDDPHIQHLLDTPGVTDALAVGLTDPDRGRIDWILTRGLRTVAAGCDERGASDHPLYWAELEIVGGDALDR